MPGDFSIVQGKLDRAKAHAEKFDRRFAEFLQRKPYTITVNADPRPPHWVHFRWGVKETPGIEFALIFGDMLSNLRGALDYLAWQLVLAGGETPTHRTAFPCVRRKDDWNGVRHDRLAGVEDRWADEIEGLQPYHRADKPEQDLFAVLDSVNNANKHRTLPPILMTLPTWEFEIEGDIGGREIDYDFRLDRPIEDGVEFARYSFNPPLDVTKLKVNPDPPLRVSFRDGLDHSDGWEYTNADLIDWVETTVRIFEPAFSG